MLNPRLVGSPTKVGLCAPQPSGEVEEAGEAFNLSHFVNFEVVV